MDCNWREAPENPGSPVRRGIPPPRADAQRARGGPVTTESLSDGDRVFSATGQEVFHVHLHVIPRNTGDGFRLRAKWRRPSRAELDSVAGQVRDGLG